LRAPYRNTSVLPWRTLRIDSRDNVLLRPVTVYIHITNTLCFVHCEHTRNCLFVVFVALLTLIKIVSSTDASTRRVCLFTQQNLVLTAIARHPDIYWLSVIRRR
jgi:hypothetical protein